MRCLHNLLAIILLSLVGSSKIFAATIECPEKLNTALGPGGTILESKLVRKGSGWGFGQSLNVSATLADCKSTIPNYKKPADNDWRYAAFTILGNANIDKSETINVSGATYYKIKNSSSTFLNTHGYIYFKFRENNPENSRKTAIDMLKAFVVDGGWNLNGYGGADQYSSPHVMIELLDIQVYFTQAPTTVESANLRLGTVQSANEVYRIYNTYRGRDDVYLTLIVKPETSQTCNLDIPAVKLTQVSVQRSLKGVGAEAGQTQFSVKAYCSEGLANTALYYSMGDNANLSNYSNVLTNTDRDTESVGIRIYDASTNLPISYNKSYNFGVLNDGLMPSVTKNFYARYYRKDISPVNVGIGSVSAQATISVTYK